jgi:hypothetical protein
MKPNAKAYAEAKLARDKFEIGEIKWLPNNN